MLYYVILWRSVTFSRFAFSTAYTMGSVRENCLIWYLPLNPPICCYSVIVIQFYNWYTHKKMLTFCKISKLTRGLWRWGVVSVCKRDGLWVRFQLGKDRSFISIFSVLAIKHSVALSFSSQYASERRKGGNEGTECLTTSFPWFLRFNLSTLLCTT